MTRHVLVRADGNGRIGLGHIMRSMSVADELQRTGVEITYLCRSLPVWAENLLHQRGFDLLYVQCEETASQTEDAAATLTAFQRVGADAVLLDHYGLTGEWTECIRSRSSAFIAAFDDLACDVRDVDMLIDSGPGRIAADYEALVPPDAICLLGPRYAPLRPEFALAGTESRGNEDGLCRIAISLGGVDPTNVTSVCLEALDGRADVDVTVILSSAAPHLKAVKDRIAAMQTPTRLLLDRTDMARVLRDMDLVIGAGGTSALERCALGLPSLLILLAENQAHNAANLTRAGATTLVPDVSSRSIHETLQTLVADADLRASMGRAAASLCDGRGAPRVGAAILAARTGVHLRPVTPDDMLLIHGWQCEPDARRFARNPDTPALAEHEKWFARRLTKIACDPFYIIEAGQEASGFVRLDPGSAPEVWEVSILISQGAQGRGLGRTALGLLRLMHPKRKIEATVHPDNKASQRLFESAGYLRIATDQFISDGWREIVERQQNEN
ncbi:MAG: UDP-2,4-diacetamido-2,4,6-trideoxy-beta-L-altropyranose hydrolase [Arenibacterium sp.]